MKNYESADINWEDMIMITYRHLKLNFNGRFDSVQKFVNLTGEFKDIEVWSSDNHWRVDAHSLNVSIILSFSSSR